MKVSISGPAGSGKSTVMKAVAEHFNAEVADIGQEFRKMAVEHGQTADEFIAYIGEHPELDREMDQRFAEYVESAEGNVVTSWRMGFHFVPSITSLWLDVSEDEGAERIYGADRGADEKTFDSVDHAKQVNHDRMEGLRRNLVNVYDVDFTDVSNYSKVIDTTGKATEEVIAEVISYLESV